MQGLLLVSALIGTTLLVARSTIFRPLQRLWPALFRCCQCVGVWVGVSAGSSGIVTTGHGWLLDAIIVGAATSFLSMLADAILLKLLGDPGENP